MFIVAKQLSNFMLLVPDELFVYSALLQKQIKRKRGKQEAQNPQSFVIVTKAKLGK
jgi:hypothetical protein